MFGRQLNVNTTISLNVIECLARSNDSQANTTLIAHILQVTLILYLLGLGLAEGVWFVL